MADLVDGRRVILAGGVAAGWTPTVPVLRAAGGFARATFNAARTPVGPSVGQRAVDFWRFADAALGTNIGPLSAPLDVSVASLAAKTPLTRLGRIRPT